MSRASLKNRENISFYRNRVETSFSTILLIIDALFTLYSSVDRVSRPSSLIPSVLPPLFPQVAIEFRLAQLLIDIVMCTTKPPTKRVLCFRSWLVCGSIFPKIFCTEPARVKIPKQLHKLFHVRLFFRTRALRVCRRDQVEQRPRRFAEFFYIRWIVLLVMI